MLVNATSLLDLPVLANTGTTLGKVSDLYFDDYTWTVRYFVVNTGALFHKHEVLISPHAVPEFVPIGRAVQTNLSEEQIRTAPDFDLAKPVSRQYEEKLGRHYQWPHYWNFPFNPIGGVWGQSYPSREDVAAIQRDLQISREEIEDSRQSHLRGVSELLSYNLVGLDDEIGIVRDIIAETEQWNICYLVAGINAGLNIKTYAVSVKAITNISWVNRELELSLRKGQVETSFIYRAEKLDEDSYVRSLNQFWSSMYADQDTMRHNSPDADHAQTEI